MQSRLFTVFHKALDQRLIYPFFTAQEIRDWIVAYAVAERFAEKRITLMDGQTHDAADVPGVVFESRLPQYDPELQRRGFMETSAYVHIHRNGLHDALDYIGISQYDMRWTLPGVAAMRWIAGQADLPSTVFAVTNGQLMDQGGRFHPLAFADKFDWDFLIASYNRHFGASLARNDLMGQPLTLFQTYLMPRREFTALAGWLERLCAQVWPWANQPPHETHWGVLGGYTERAEALFFAAGLQARRFVLRHLPLEHDQAIPVRLGIAKEHYAGG